MKESNIDRVFSPSEEETESIKQKLKKAYLSQERISFEKERPKTPEEVEIIEFLDKETNLIALEFGGEGATVQENIVHIIAEDEYKNFQEEDTESDAVFSTRLQGIAIKDKVWELPEFTKILGHEMIHLKSYQSMKSNWKESKSLLQRRVGFGIHMRKKKKVAFIDLNEAMTEYLTQRMIRDRWAEKRGVLPEMLKAKTHNINKEQFIESFGVSYVLKQLSFMEIMDKIKEKYPDEYKNREDVLKVFGEAYFTGKLLKLRKMIDNTYGNGSFVEFAKEGLPPSKHETNERKDKNK